MKEQTFVYVVAAADIAENGGLTRADKHVKIGVANDMIRRLKELQCGNPRKLVVAYSATFSDRTVAETVERQSHALLRSYRRHGEWFFCDVPTAVRAITRSRSSISTAMEGV